MKVQVLDVSAYEREVEVELPADKVRWGVDQAILKLKSRVRVKGFRKGKIPRGVLVKRFHDLIDHEASERLIEATFGDALARHGLVPVNEPVLERGDVEEGHSFKYTLRFEVMPKIEVEGYEGVEIEGSEAAVDDEAVGEELERMRQMRASFQAADRSSAKGDRVTFEIDGEIDGEPLRSGEGADQATVGEGELIEPLDAALLGAKAGDTMSVDHTFEESDEGPMAGRRIQATVRLVDVQERIVPELDDEFAKDHDFDDLAALRESTHARLQEAAEEEARRDNERQVIEAILEANEFEIPPSLVRDRTEAQLRSAARMFADAGLDPRSLGDPKELQERTRERVVFEVRKQVVVDSVARQKGVEVSDEDVDAKIEDLAKESKQPLPKVRARYAQGEGRTHLEHMLRTERVLDFLLSEAKIGADSED